MKDVLKVGRIDERLYPVYCEPGKNVEQMIHEANFSHYNADISNGNYPDEKIDGVRCIIRIIKFPQKFVSNDEILFFLTYNDFKPCPLRPLLAFAKKYPKEQGKQAIVATGSKSALVEYGISKGRVFNLPHFPYLSSQRHVVSGEVMRTLEYMASVYWAAEYYSFAAIQES